MFLRRVRAVCIGRSLKFWRASAWTGAMTIKLLVFCPQCGWKISIFRSKRVLHIPGDLGKATLAWSQPPPSAVWQIDSKNIQSPSQPVSWPLSSLFLTILTCMPRFCNTVKFVGWFVGYWLFVRGRVAFLRPLLVMHAISQASRNRQPPDVYRVLPSIGRPFFFVGKISLSYPPFSILR